MEKEFSFLKGLAKAEAHDFSKYVEDFLQHVLVSWHHHQVNNNEEPIPFIGEMKEACFNHIKGSSHHPEYFDETIISYDKSIMVDATKMGPIDIAKMVADWCAISAEMIAKYNIPFGNVGEATRDYADAKIGIRWKFSEEQIDLIYKLIDACGEET